jgi:hypothetical protein
MRQNHVAGERMFVDYAGATLAVIDPSTGEARTAQLFVAVLGASIYTYAEATCLDAGSVRLDRLTYTRLCVRWRPGDGGVKICARASPRPASTSRRSTAPPPTIDIAAILEGLCF